MELTAVDIVVFVGFLVAVVAIGLWKSRGEVNSEDYFLAGRGLRWPLIGFSLIAANISAESFIGMSGIAARPDVGLAIASYDWIAAITLVVVAFWFLPPFLRSGIFTIPQFLEYRFDHTARTIMSLLMVGTYVFVTITAVIYMGAKAFEPLFNDITITQLSWMVGIAAAIYVFAGGLKACAWADLIQGAALFVGGAIVTVLAFMALDDPDAYAGTSAAAVNNMLDLDEGASLSEKFAVLKADQMHMKLPLTSEVLPWTALLLGIWIPNFYYWGFNQYIIQRTLGSKSLAEGQQGIVFAAGMKLLMPFIVCFPGIIAFTLYHDQMAASAMTNPQLNAPVLAQYQAAIADPEAGELLIPFDNDFARLYPEEAATILAFNTVNAGMQMPDAGRPLAEANAALIETVLAEHPERAVDVAQTLVGYDYDSAFPLLIRYLTPAGLRGFVLAALMGAVISSLASMLNAASTIFTMDIWREWINRQASQKQLIWVGRLCVPIAVSIGCLIAPQLAKPEYKGAFNFIQEFQGFVSPGVLTIFLFGLFVPRTPRVCGTLGLLLSPVIYGILFFGFSEVAFLNRMAITVGAIAAILALITLIKPLKQPVILPEQSSIVLDSSPRALVLGVVVCICTVALYIIFW